jgi:hypothetical protein
MTASLQSPRVLLTRREAAQACGLCERTLQNHTAPHGTLVATYIGRSVRYRPEDLERWVASLRHQPEVSSNDAAVAACKTPAELIALFRRAKSAGDMALMEAARRALQGSGSTVPTLEQAAQSEGGAK